MRQAGNNFRLKIGENSLDRLAFLRRCSRQHSRRFRPVYTAGTTGKSRTCSMYSAIHSACVCAALRNSSGDISCLIAPRQPRVEPLFEFCLSPPTFAGRRHRRVRKLPSARDRRNLNPDRRRKFIQPTQETHASAHQAHPHAASSLATIARSNATNNSGTAAATPDTIPSAPAARARL